MKYPPGVTVTVKDDVVTVKGPKGELSQKINPDLTVNVADGHVTLTRPSDDREHRAQHGLYRALIHNMVVGVSQGYRKEMELVGVGYRATSEGQVLELALGFSHAIFIKLPKEIKVEAKTDVIRILLLFSKAMTSSSLVRCALRFVRFASLSLTRAKVLSLSVKLSVVSQVNRQVLNN